MNSISEILTAIKVFRDNNRREPQCVKLSQGFAQDLSTLPAVELDSVFGDGSKEWLEHFLASHSQLRVLLGNIGGIDVEFVRPALQDLLVL